MSAYPKQKNPFDDDDDDQYSFGNKSKGYRNVGSSRTYNGRTEGYGFDDEPSDFERPKTRLELLEEQKQLSRNRQADMTRNALASIYDSERMGVATAEELVHQGEQLDNVERKTAQINQDMKVSQKHLNSIKSVFGGLKNWWTGKKEEPKQEEKDTSRSRLRDTIEKDRQSGNHPALRLRSEDYRGFYDDSDEQDSYRSGTKTKSGYSQSYMNREDEVVDKNLDLMSDGMSRLKNLALDLGNEIEQQNDQIDRIGVNTDRANVTLNDQNRQIRKILR